MSEEPSTDRTLRRWQMVATGVAVLGLVAVPWTSAWGADLADAREEDGSVYLPAPSRWHLFVWGYIGPHGPVVGELPHEPFGLMQWSSLAAGVLILALLQAVTDRPPRREDAWANVMLLVPLMLFMGVILVARARAFDVCGSGAIGPTNGIILCIYRQGLGQVVTMAGLAAGVLLAYRRGGRAGSGAIPSLPALGSQTLQPHPDQHDSSSPAASKRP